MKIDPPKIVILLLLVFSSLLVPDSSEAIPAFARKYITSCTQCHHAAYPRLNEFGRRFKVNGYQYPAGAEDPYRAHSIDSPGTVVEKLDLFRDVPLSVRIQNNVTINQSKSTATAKGINRSDFNFPSEAYLIGGGSIFKNISALFSMTLAPEIDLHYATLGVHNLFGEGWLNVQIGRFFLIDDKRPQHRRLTLTGNAPNSVMVGLNSFRLDSHQAGINLSGRPNWGPISYRIAVVNGSEVDERDADGYRDVYGRVALHIKDKHTVGLMGYSGRSNIIDNSGTAPVTFKDRFFIVGLDTEWELGPVTAYTDFTLGQHQNADGTNRNILYVAGTGQLTYSVTRDWIAILAYHQVQSSDAPSLELRHLVPHVSYLLLRNLKLGLEYRADLKDFDQSQAYLLAEATF